MLLISQAGIPSQQLILTLEPEVAAIYTIRGSKPDLASGSQDQYASGTQILLVDLGGGSLYYSDPCFHILFSLYLFLMLQRHLQ